jgi:hypothetical protein
MGFLSNLFGKKESAHPNLFEEMQSVLRTSLLQLGFEEKVGSGRSKYAEYSRGELYVWLTWDILDSIYYVSASSKTDVVNDKKSPVLDFRTECSSMKKADEFKRESIEKLNAWLVQKRVR